MRLDVGGGVGTVIISPSRDYVAKGGQAKIYEKGGIAYKVFHDPSKMISLGRIQDLAALGRGKFIIPENVIRDTKGNAIGYTMKFIDDCVPLCQLFPPAFRERQLAPSHVVTHDLSYNLILNLQRLFVEAHSKGFLLVDANELNFLVRDRTWDELYAIDCDAYETPNHPATALMPTVKDWHTPRFNVNSDWFSFAVLAFQLFIGIHPYRGRYEGSVEGYAKKLPTDADDDKFAVTRRRMQDNISVFNKDVSIPAAAYSFDIVPKEYLFWLESVLDGGKRLPPPGEGPVPTVMAMPVFEARPVFNVTEERSTGVFIIELVKSISEKINEIFFSPEGEAILSRTRITGPSFNLLGSGYQGVCFSSRWHHPIGVKHDDVVYGIPKFVVVGTGLVLDFNTSAKEIMFYGGRVYLRGSKRIVEVVPKDIGGGVLLATKVVANVMERTTKMFPGGAAQSILGACYVNLFPEAGRGHQIEMPELDDYLIMGAKFESRVLMVVGIKPDGQYDRLVFRFDEYYDIYDCRVIEDIGGYYDPNFTVLDSGMTACLNEEEKLELFSNKPGALGVKVIEDDALNSKMTLYHKGNQVLFSIANSVFTITMKKAK